MENKVDNHKNSSSHTCSECEHFMGGGDWNLCCSKPHEGYLFGFLCYEDTKACEMFEKKQKHKKNIEANLKRSLFSEEVRGKNSVFYSSFVLKLLQKMIFICIIMEICIIKIQNQGLQPTRVA